LGTSVSLGYLPFVLERGYRFWQGSMCPQDWAGVVADWFCNMLVGIMGGTHALFLPFPEGTVNLLFGR
jgi:hypothetical protein